VAELDAMVRAGRLDFGDNHTEIMAFKRVGGRLHKVVHRADAGHVGNPRAAGNRGEIVLSAVVPENYDTTGLEVLLSQPILTRPGLRRIYVRVQVGKLAEMLRHNDKPAFSLEHIYDF
jgi:hypothetical protein